MNAAFLPNFNNFASVYGLGALALLFVIAYYVFVSGILRIPRSHRVSVARYEPPTGASPGVAAWLYERGRLPRAMAASLVNMAAKGYVKIEQTEDLVTVTQIATEAAAPLEPEEDVLARIMFRGYDIFEFVQSTPQLAKCVDSFHIALLNTRYFLPHVGLSIPAWGVSGIASAVVLIYGISYSHGSGRGLEYLIGATIGCFVVAARTLPGTFEKIACRVPGSTAPRRPWTGADAKPIFFLAASLLGVSLIGLMFNALVALVLAGFMAVNVIFYYALQGPSASGRQILEQLDDYKDFLSKADGDFISRVNPSERVPDHLDTKHAYAIAFHLDLGWGEQFVTSIADVVECAQVFVKNRDDDDIPSLTGP
jgi:predicted membrane protein DUF2207